MRQGAVHKPNITMSLEDLDSDFLSDENDYEAEKNLSDGEKDDDDVSNYLELVYLHNNLMCFQHIYNNNAIIDMQVGQLMLILTDSSTKYSFSESITD